MASTAAVIHHYDHEAWSLRYDRRDVYRDIATRMEQNGYPLTMDGVQDMAAKLGAYLDTKDGQQPTAR